MAGMTLAQMRTYVRDTLELDSTEIGDTLLDQWIQEGYDHIVYRRDRPWKVFECNWSFTTIAGTQDYGHHTGQFVQAFLFSGQTAIPQTFSMIYNTSYGNLEQQPHDWLVAAYTGSARGRPIYYSDRTDRISLWPTPDAAYTYQVEGYRYPVDWIASGAGAQPDLPYEFHPLIARWALGLAYAQQDQPDMTALHHGAVDNALRPMLQNWQTETGRDRLVLNRGLPTEGRLKPWLDRPRFTFE